MSKPKTNIPGLPKCGRCYLYDVGGQRCVRTLAPASLLDPGCAELVPLPPGPGGALARRASFVAPAERVTAADVLDSFRPGEDASSFELARMLVARGCTDGAPEDVEPRVARHLRALETAGKVARAGRRGHSVLWRIR